MKEITTFDVFIDEEDELGVDKISLVKRPAIETNFVYMNEEAAEEYKQIYLSEDEKKIVTGPALIPNLEIIRKDDAGEPYYIKYSAEQIEKMAQRFFKDKDQYSVNKDHKTDVQDVYIYESWIVGENDKAKDMGFDVPKGTWMISMKVENDEIWNGVKSGKYKGFSIEGLFKFKKSNRLVQQKKWTRKNINSSNVDKVMFNDETNELVVQFNDGDRYTYFDIDFVEFYSVVDGLAECKTKGENKWGEWYVDKTPSVGAAVWQYLIDTGKAYRKGGSFQEEVSLEKISFDYDETLTTDAGMKKAKELIDAGNDVYIISARSDKEPMLNRAKELGIPESRVIATGSNKAKVEKVKELDIKKHYDNNADVIKELGTIGEKFEMVQLVHPGASETEEEFIGRCMGDDKMNSEYPDQAQRTAVCYAYWDEKQSVELETYNDYPESAKNAAKRALEWADKNGWGDCGTPVGKARANQLAKGENISEETISRMASFARHLQNKDVPYSEGCGGLMVDAWGGQAGIEWAQNKLKEIRQSNLEKDTKNNNINMASAILKDGSTLYTDAETMEVGVEVYFMNGEEKIKPEAGEYVLEDGSTVVVGEDAKIAEIKPASSDVVEAEQGMKDKKETKMEIDPMLQEQFDAIKGMLENLNLKIDALTSSESEDMAKVKQSLENFEVKLEKISVESELKSVETIDSKKKIAQSEMENKKSVLDYNLITKYNKKF